MPDAAVAATRALTRCVRHHGLVRLTAGISVLAASCALLLGGCASSEPDPVIYSSWHGGFSLDALAFGELTLVDGCVVTSPDGNGDTIGLIAFPRRYSSWDAATQTLTYGGKDYHLGDEIAAGGGGVSHPTSLAMSDECRELVDEHVNVFIIMDKSIDPADHAGVATER